MVWTGDTIPDRVAKTKEIIAKFTEATGIQVELVGVDEDQFNQLLTSAAAAGELPDVVGSQPLAAVRTLSTNELLNKEAAKAVIDALGAETFSAKSLELTRRVKTQLSVPSDAWSQLLYYRKDLFDKAGIKAPETYADIMAAAKALDTPKLAGFVGATTPGDAFTQQTFEQIALGNGCEMVDDKGTDHDRQSAVRGGVPVLRRPDQAVLGLGHAGRRHRSRQLLRRPVRHGHLVDLPARRAGRAAQRRQAQLRRVQEGSRSSLPPTPASWPPSPARTGSRRSSVRSPRGRSPPPPRPSRPRSSSSTCSSDGYLDWIAIAPEGKYPVRAGTKENPKQFVDAWKDPRGGRGQEGAALGDFYPQEVIDILTSGADKFSRWGITQGQGDLIGASLGELPDTEGHRRTDDRPGRRRGRGQAGRRRTQHDQEVARVRRP